MNIKGYFTAAEDPAFISAVHAGMALFAAEYMGVMWFGGNRRIDR